MNTTTFLTTFGIIFLAELGDKTQLTAIALATRYPWRKIFIGMTAAFVLLNLVAVLIGKLLFSFLPLFWIMLISGILFLFFGINSIRNSGLDSENTEDGGQLTKTMGPLVISFFMILLAELGDKTQLLTTSLAAQYDSQLMVFAGSTLALWTVSLIGIFAGKQLTRFISLSTIHKIAGGLFIIFALAIFYRTSNY